MKINSRNGNEIMAEEFKKGIAIQRFTAAWREKQKCIP